MKFSFFKAMILIAFLIIVVSLHYRGFLQTRIDVLLGKKPLTFEEKIELAYKEFEDLKKVNEGSVSTEFNFSQFLMLIDQVNQLVKLGPDFDPTEPGHREYLLWLRKNLEEEKNCYQKKMGVTSSFISGKTKRATNYYYRSIQDSLKKVDGWISTVNTLHA